MLRTFIVSPSSVCPTLIVGNIRLIGLLEVAALPRIQDIVALIAVIQIDIPTKAFTT
jgi:hypothetical protein